jgi:5'-nucleotidase/UDP-sugar diphosphatase
MKRFCAFLIVCLIIAAVGVPVYASAAREEGSGELVLLHTNDHHGAVLSSNGRGGLAERASYIRAVRAMNTQVLLLDAGDINTGSALANMFYAEIDFRAYNMMAYDAVAFGNHEFDGPLGRLKQQIAQAEFPFVCSNIKTPDGGFLGGNRYIVKKYDNFTVGVFGITTLRTINVANPSDSDLNFIDEIEAARETLEILRNTEKVDIVIALTHIGNVKEAPDHVTSPELAEAVEGIDIIIDGHSHTFMESPVKVNGTWIVSANEWGKYMGHGKLIVRNHGLSEFIWKPIAIGPDREVAAMIEPYAKKAGESLKEVIGTAAEEFEFGNRLPRYQETAVGNLVTDANCWYFTEAQKQNLDFAFHNGGNIRAGLAKGAITREQILTILPFENYLYIVSLKGSEIIELFDVIANIPQGAGGFPQFSKEVRYTIDKQAGAVAELSIGGSPVDPDKTYRFCTNDFLLGGGDGYAILEKSTDRFNTSQLLSNVVIEYIRASGGSVSPVIDGRLTVLNGVNP